VHCVPADELQHVTGVAQARTWRPLISGAVMLWTPFNNDIISVKWRLLFVCHAYSLPSITTVEPAWLHSRITGEISRALTQNRTVNASASNDGCTRYRAMTAVAGSNLIGPPTDRLPLQAYSWPRLSSSTAAATVTSAFLVSELYTQAGSVSVSANPSLVAIQRGS